MSTGARFVTILVILGSLILFGTAGYRIIEGWSLTDSLYMTFIAITTVGFGEVHPLSMSGKFFTMVLLVFSIATVGYSVTILMSFIFEGQFIEAIKERRMERAVRRLRDHYVICGHGSVGHEVAEEFRREKVKFVVIDRDPTGSMLERENTLYIQGDAADDVILTEANIANARGMVCALPDDESNLFVVLSARQLNPKLFIVSQASDERSSRKIIKAGADRIITSAKIAGQRLASTVLRPTVVQFLDVAMGSAEAAMRLEEVPVRSGSPLIDQTLRQTQIGQHTGALVVGIQRATGQTSINLSETATLSGMILRENDVLIVLGNEEQVKRMRSFATTGKTK